MNHTLKTSANRPMLARLATNLKIVGLLVAGSVALSLAPILAPSAVQAQAPASTDMARAVEALRSISTLRADFTQRADNGQQVSGVLSLKRGGKIRFAYQRSYPVQITSDGKALTIVDSAVNQIQRWPIGNSPLGALLDPAKDVTRYGSLLPSYEPSTVTVRVVDRSHPEYGTMMLVFEKKPSAPGGLELAAWQTIDAQNRRTSVRLSGHQYGLALSDDLFRFVDPRARPHK